MSEHLKIQFTRAARRDAEKIGRSDPERLAAIEALLAEVEENGWVLSLRSEAIKVLRSKTCIGEIRLTGSGGYRLFFFWYDTNEARELWVSRILPKRDVTSHRRLSDVLDTVAEVRKRFLEDEE
jgi:mRNA-degrading endonuclease RelE of RelBE toxin-antitoxin system